jgi:DNA-directed RNA polymerase specialized sigma24 family protein
LDRETFEQYYTESAPKVHKIVVRKWGGQYGLDFVDDVLGITYLKAWEKRHTFTGNVDGFRKWLVQIAMMTAIDAYRRDFGSRWRKDSDRFNSTSAFSVNRNRVAGSVRVLNASTMNDAIKNVTDDGDLWDVIPDPDESWHPERAAIKNEERDEAVRKVAMMRELALSSSGRLPNGVKHGNQVGTLAFDVFEMLHGHEMSLQEIADKLGGTRGGMKSATLRARRAYDKAIAISA